MTTWTRVSAVTASGLMLVGLVGVPAAQAYPPGSKATVFTQTFKYKPKAKIRARAFQVQPRCRVQFTFRGFSFNKVKSVRANANGIANATISKGPKQSGKYRVLIQTSGRGCKSESASVTFRVR
jgi:hypothetical protein